jgi:protein TonB
MQVRLAAPPTLDWPSLDWRRIGAMSASFLAHLVAAALIAAPLTLLPLKRETPKSLDVHLIDVPPPPPAVPSPPEPIAPPKPHRPRVPVAMPPPAPPVAAPTAPTTPAMPAPVQAAAPSEAPAAVQTAPADSGYGESRTLAYDGTLRLAYPPASLRAREQGTVVLRVLVDADGNVQRSEIARSSGFPKLDAAAREAVGRAHFRPVLRDGKPMPAWGLVPIDFRLDRA